jgi:hypothetical protein
VAHFPEVRSTHARTLGALSMSAEPRETHRVVHSSRRRSYRPPFVARTRRPTACVCTTRRARSRVSGWRPSSTVRAAHIHLGPKWDLGASPS